MELRLTPLHSIQSIARATQALTKTSAVQRKGFQDALTDALQATSALQKESGRLTTEFTLDNPTVSLEETMIAGQKSGIAFQATLQVRNKVVQAYSDIMNLQL